MKKNIFFVIGGLLGCLMAAQTYRVLAQTNNDSNVDWSHIAASEMISILQTEKPGQIPTNAWTSILEKLKWSEIPTNAQDYIARHVLLSQFPTNFDIYSMTMPAPAWPDSPQKQQRFKQSIEMLRSAIDTNQLALIEKQLLEQIQSTNQSENGSQPIPIATGKEMLLAFENFSTQMRSNLEEFADLLTSPQLKTYDVGWGRADITSPSGKEGKIKFDFQSRGPISSVTQETADGDWVIVQALFGRNGKLMTFWSACREPEGFPFATAKFEANGQLQSFSGIVTNQLQFEFYPGRTGHIEFRMNHLEKPVHPR